MRWFPATEENLMIRGVWTFTIMSYDSDDDDSMIIQKSVFRHVA